MVTWVNTDNVQEDDGAGGGGKGTDKDADMTSKQ